MTETCPTCEGEKVVRAAFHPIQIPCPDCDGSGSVPAGVAERKAAGAKLKAERMAQGLSLREWCLKTGESASTRSSLERGFAP